MVKKLFKHEFLYYTRVMSLVYLILLTIAGAGRVMQFFESDNIVYKIISVFYGLTYGISVLAAFGFVFVLAIVRFYKNLYSSEGYLTFTLPATPAQHIWVKAITAVCMELVTLAVILLSGCVFSAGELLVEIWKAGAYILGTTYDLIGFHLVVILAEFSILFVLMLLAGIMMYYTFISIGQLFKKNRILAAVGAYFVYYIASQVISTVLYILITILSMTDRFADFMFWLGNLVQQHPYTFVHCGLWLYILIPVIFLIVEFVVIRRIITNKLNLE